MKLADGRELTVDLNCVTRKDIRLMYDNDTAEELSDEVFGRIVGLTLDEVQELGFLDQKRIARAIFKAITAPLEDEGEVPNSLSASTSDS